MTDEISATLRERAQVLLDSIAPGGVPPAVAEEFLRDLAAIVSGAVEGAVDAEREDTEVRWFQAGLGGARWEVGYPSQEAAAQAVAWLMSDGHGHHFAVVGEGRSVLMSKMATECLRTRAREETRQKATELAQRAIRGEVE